MRPTSEKQPTGKRLLELLEELPAGERAAALQAAASFRPEVTLEESIAVGPLRAALADYWEQCFQEPVPIVALREVMDPPVSIATVLKFLQVGIGQDRCEREAALGQLVQYLRRTIEQHALPKQRWLFHGELSQAEPADDRPRPLPAQANDLQILLDAGIRFRTIYADPPWSYENTASRAAAENHYPTMSVEEICAEPVDELARENAHLHLWTTNGFLREAFQVIDAWGFEYKSCLVWVKNELGMGNYWRVSHEYLLLGVRGSLTFRDNTRASWIQAPRTIHSRKPGVVRELIERVSPGPYLELYGREIFPDSAWTVYGNQIERRLF